MLALVLLVVLLVVSRATTTTPTYKTFRPGQHWLDTTGCEIRAHSGGLLDDPQSNRTYWYGSEGYPGGDALLNTKINVYSSSDGDLMNWRPEGVAFEMPRQGLCAAPPPNPANPPTCYADRCKVIHNAATQKYVMWCKSKPFASVAVANAPVGPFHLVDQIIPGGHEVGDCTVHVDPTDASAAYFILSVHPEHPNTTSGYGFSHDDERQLKIFQLTPDWTNLTGEYRNATALWPLPNKYDGKLEAPAAFHDPSTMKHYIWTSHCTYWFPNDAVLLESAEMFASQLWQRKGNPTHNDTSWQSQSTFVLPVPSVQAEGSAAERGVVDGVYTAAGAPWIYIADRFMCNFDSGVLPGCPDYVQLNQTGRYVWLPIERDGDKLVVNWHDEWKLKSDDDELRGQPTGDICPQVASGQPCPLPKGCAPLSATGTDESMKWFCQSPNRAKTVYRHYTDCTDEHIVCTPKNKPQAAPLWKDLVVFLPGTGLVPQDYSQIVADFASHGFHSIGLMYPSTQGQVSCQMSRTARPTDLNCTARERFRVLTGQASSFGGTDRHTNITAPDSIVNRVAKALKTLGPPWSNWLEADGSPRWADIIIAGHSNGADHTGFLAKTYKVSRALMFAGANDMVGVVPKGQYVHPAPWQFAAGATPPSHLFGFGVCGSKAHGASGICWDWHAGWGAQQLPGPWFRTDAVLRSGSLSGYHKLCSNGSLVDKKLSNHMASAGDCCVPKFGADAGELAGKMIWTRIYQYMLTTPIDAPLGSTVADETCACEKGLKNSQWGVESVDDTANTAHVVVKSDDDVAAVGITFSRPIRCNASEPCPPAPAPAHADRDATTLTTSPSPSCHIIATVGCFQWPRLDYMAGFFPTFKNQNQNFTQEVCAASCCAAGYGSDAVSAVSLHPKMHGGPWALMGADCYCATAQAFATVFATARRNFTECDQKCPGNKSQSCGGAPLGAQQRLLVSRSTCENCASVPAPPTPSAVHGVRPIVGAGNVYVGTRVCCLWDGKCRARCPNFPHCRVHDVPNSVNATRTVVFRNWSTQVTTAIIANANDYPQAHEGPNENAACLLSDNKTVFTVMRLGAGDYGGYYSDYLQSRSTDVGVTWSKPSFILGAGSADPKLLRVGGHVVMSGGRNCNEINKTVDGVKRGADLMLWLNGDGMAKSWTVYSLSYWHNKLWMNPSMIDWHNCTRRGPNCFSSGVNTSCRTETSAYTSLTLDQNATDGAGWVKYDMHGIPFAMRFVIKTDDYTFHKVKC